MEQRAIGSLRVSVVGLGCNQIGTTCDARASKAIVHRALDLGINCFDTAEEYGDGRSEEVLAEALQGRRQGVVIATKFAGWVDGAPSSGRATAAGVVEAVEGSLRRLKTDVIDLYQLHFPDPATPIEETLRALDRLTASGKVREIGCCNLSGAEIDEAARICAEAGLRPFVSAQNRLNLLRQEALDDVAPACERHRMGLLPYFPLAAGVLTGKYRRGEPPPADSRMGRGDVAAERAQKILTRAFGPVEALEAFARARGHTVAELAVAWLAAQPTVASVIAGATRPQQVEANVRAAAWRLTAEEAAQAAKVARADAKVAGAAQGG
ncbi:MAG: aldo/keto reductase [Caulobacteraceae bacterium]|nr:aldo/keto reductase [Caulobacteraceae bacterium]